MTPFNPDNFSSDKKPIPSFFESEALRAAGIPPKNLSSPWYKSFLQFITAILMAGGLFGIIFIPLVVYSMFSMGYVGMKLWNWFIFGFIPGAPTMTILQALGISLLLRLFTYENPYAVGDGSRTATSSQKIGRLIGLAMLPWVTLLIAYIIHRLM